MYRFRKERKVKSTRPRLDKGKKIANILMKDEQKRLLPSHELTAADPRTQRGQKISWGDRGSGRRKADNRHTSMDWGEWEHGVRESHSRP